MKIYIKPMAVILSIEQEFLLAASPAGEKLKVFNSVSDMPAMSKKHECFQDFWNDDKDEEYVDENM